MMCHITIYKYHINNSDDWHRYIYCEDDEVDDRNDDDVVMLRKTKIMLIVVARIMIKGMVYASADTLDI